jgi:hypothetical protein
MEAILRHSEKDDALRIQHRRIDFPMTHLQAYLRGGGTFAALEQEFAIVAVPSTAHPSLTLFKYHQILSPMHEPIVQESRGIVLDAAEDWCCVARGYDKFFNYGEPHAAEIDWSTARIQEKVDGSLCLLHRYQGIWKVATTGSPDASGPVNANDFTFADLFWETLRSYALPNDIDTGAQGLTLLFELTTPHNRVVVPHQTCRLTLLGARQTEEGTWLSAERTHQLSTWLNVPTVQEFPLQNVEEILASFTALNPLEQEGYVVVDAAHRRIKVKHPQYVAIHHMRSAFSRKAFLEVIRAGETPEVVSYYPELKAEFEAITKDYEALCQEADLAYAHHSSLETQKEFALAISGHRCSAALFKIRTGQAQNAAAFYAQTPLSNLLKLLGYKEE